MKSNLLFILLLIALTISCTPKKEAEPSKDMAAEMKASALNKASMESLMQKHLDAVSNRDLQSLESTLTPEGNMQLILPGSEIIKSNEAFMQYHKEWFEDTTWTFDTKILNSKAGNILGMAVTEIIYREPERDGLPYFNRMIVSYDLEKREGKWYVIKDHASSVEKSTDK